MMITIHGLPLSIKYADLKVLIKQKCNISEFILDSLIIDSDKLRKVRVGLTDDSEGNHLIKCLDGYILSGHVLRVVPNVKSSLHHTNAPQQNAFDTRETYQRRNEYQNQMPDRNREEALDTEPWASKTLFTGNQPVHSQVDTYKYQQDMMYAAYGHPMNQQKELQFQPQDVTQHSQPGFSYSQNSNLINLGPNSSCEVTEASVRPIQGNRYPQHSYDTSNPTLQNNFQGQQFNSLTGLESAPENYQSASQPASWSNQQPQSTTFEKSMPESFEKKQYKERKYSPTKPTDEVAKMDEYLGYDARRAFSPPRRRERERSYRRETSDEERDSSQAMSHLKPLPSTTGFSANRMTYPERRSGRVSPYERPISRSSSERHFTTTHRPLEFTSRQSSPPPVRRLSPRRQTAQRKLPYSESNLLSPDKVKITHGKLSPRSRSPSCEPIRGMVSRVRQRSPRRLEIRYSRQDEQQNVKNVRPAYESPVTASDEDKYSGRYRANVREDVQYSLRGQEQHWQEREFVHKSLGEDRRDTRHLKFDIPRASEQQRAGDRELRRSRSDNRSSRSPRRNRSPMQDRYRRQSQSQSPRRSWALEKRHRVDMHEPPPPPRWPGQDSKNSNYQNRNYQNFTEQDRDLPDRPVWKLSQDKTRDDFIRQRNADREHFEEEMRRRKTSSKWKPLPQTSSKATMSRYTADNRSQRVAKFGTEVFEERREFNRVDDDDQTVGRRNRESSRKERDDLSYKHGFGTKNHVLHEKDVMYNRTINEAELHSKGELSNDPGYGRSRHRDEDRNSNETDEERHEGYSHKDRREYHVAHSSKYEPPQKTRHECSEAQKVSISSAPVNSKRNTAVEQIAEKILSKHGHNLPADLLPHVRNKLKLSVSKILTKMFGSKDVSFIEFIIKFNFTHTAEDEQKIFDAVTSSFETPYNSEKRSAKGNSNVPAKNPRLSEDPNLGKDIQSTTMEQISDWSILPNTVVNAPLRQVPPAGLIMSAPVMVPLPTQYQFVPTPMYCNNQGSTGNEETNNDNHNLYLCKDDFQPIEEYETTQLKNFLVQQLIKVTQTSQGWAPDFTLVKQYNTYRHEIITRDERSRDWILGLDFSEFKDFNVLVYSTEELWYERAAIWLPGHSRCRNIDPLVKLKLQNKQLEGVNIGKWKFVKKITTDKGTRVYVDMPPSAARALEKHKMMLSFELQKVNVFLKAVAIDKEAFDAGLNERSVDLVPSPASDAMPSITGQDKDIIKIGFKGNKPLTTVTLARKVKETIIYKLYRYHQLNGRSRTDYIKYGFCQSGYFCLLPENKDSRKWICDLDLGKINRVPLIIVGTDEVKNRYFNMRVFLPRDIRDITMSPIHFCERLRQSNRGVKGLNFNLWKIHKFGSGSHRKQHALNVDMDVESIETIIRMNYKLDFVVDSREHVAIVESNLPKSKLENMIAKYKAELSDKYDVTNMDIASDSEDDIICLD